MIHCPTQLKLTLAALLGATSLECDRNRSSEPPTIEVSSEHLAAGGLYIVYVWGCARGCDQLAKGDLIVAVDGVPVTTSRPLP